MQLSHLICEEKIKRRHNYGQSSQWLLYLAHIPVNSVLLERIAYFVFLCRMFLSLWLFVEFVFLQKKQLSFSDLKEIPLLIMRSSKNPTYIGPTGSSSATEGEDKTKVRYEAKKIHNNCVACFGRLTNKIPGKMTMILCTNAPESMSSSSTNCWKGLKGENTNKHRRLNLLVPCIYGLLYTKSALI